MTPHQVVVATDERFAMPTAVTLRSLVQNGGGPFSIAVLHDGLADETCGLIQASIPGDTHTIQWVDLSGFEVGATTQSHLPDSTYFRLELEAAVPEDVERAIYLDTDVLVRRDLGHLFEVDLGGAALGAVRSVYKPSMATHGGVDNWPILGLDPRAPFFNAGVLVVDLPRWRCERVADSALRYLRSDLCGRGADQEALNVVLEGNWHQLPPVWNQQTPLLGDVFGAHLIHSAEEIDAGRTDPAIVHFQTRPKPWQLGCDHPWRYDWLEMARSTAFSRVCGYRERSLLEEWSWRTRRAASALVKGR